MNTYSKRMARLKGRRESEQKGKGKTAASAKEIMDSLSSGMTFCTRLAFFVGFLALASYLGSAQHLVTGVNLTDAFLLAVLAVALGFLGLLMVIVGALIVGAQTNFLVTTVASDATMAHLSVRQKWLVCTFVATVIGYTLLVPWLYLQMPGMDDWLIWTALAANAAVALGLAWFWDRIQRLCRAPGTNERERPDLVDRLAEGFGTAGLLLYSPLTAAFLLTSLDVKVVIEFALIGAFGVLGLRVAFIRGARVTQSWPRAGRTIMAATLFSSTLLVFLLPAFDGNTGVKKAFQLVSLNVPNATVEVSADNLKRLDRAAHQQRRPLQVCRNADGSATLTNVQVLWHTLGNTGLIELWSESSDLRTFDETHRPRFQASPYEKIFHVLGTEGLRLPMDNSGLRVLTGGNFHCFELNGRHFEGESFDLSVEAKRNLAQQLEALRDSLPAPKRREGRGLEQAVRLEIVGYADPASGPLDHDRESAGKRADAVYNLVKDWVKNNAPQWVKAEIGVRTESSSEQVRKCHGLDSSESMACKAFNRRVAVRLTMV